jgi:hypothetical protein
VIAGSGLYIIHRERATARQGAVSGRAPEPL